MRLFFVGDSPLTAAINSTAPIIRSFIDIFGSLSIFPSLEKLLVNVIKLSALLKNLSSYSSSLAPNPRLTSEEKQGRKIEWKVFFFGKLIFSFFCSVTTWKKIASRFRLCNERKLRTKELFFQQCFAGGELCNIWKIKLFYRFHN